MTPKTNCFLSSLAQILNLSLDELPGFTVISRSGKETEFDTGVNVTVKISEGCLTIIAVSNEVQELREELYQVKQVVKGMKDGMFSVLNES
ncbi:TPA: toxin SymE, type I toxin-antitoxin system family protein [Citrobacter farmeri]